MKNSKICMMALAYLKGQLSAASEGKAKQISAKTIK